MNDLPNVSWFESELKGDYRFIAVFCHETGASNVCAMVGEASPQIARNALHDWVLSVRRAEAEEDEAA